MSKCIVLLLLCFLRIVRGTGSENSESETSTQESLDVDLRSVESLAEIKQDEVLPLIVFENPNQHQKQYQMPEKLLKFELTDNGRLSSGTQFKSRESSDQIFFCPRDQENSSDKCVVRRIFDGSEPLRCTSDPTPRWEYVHDRCKDGWGNMFGLVYKVCKNDDDSSGPLKVLIYKICYDVTLQRTLYTDHEIQSSGLLNLNLLARERSMDYPVVFSEENYFLSHSITKDEFKKETDNSKKPSYNLQQLVPAEDMAFATWRKTTFNNLNYEWQHETLISLWNEISRNIRSVVKNYTSSGKEKFHVNTAVIGMRSNIWAKMISVSTALTRSQPTYGMAIFMNDFIDNGSSRDIHLLVYCEMSLCIDELTEKFWKIGGAIQCCPITSKILSIFDFEPMPTTNTSKIKEIRVPNVTITQDQETLSDPITPEKAATSLREIQPSEMLPLITTFNQFDINEITTILYPTRIVKIETKNQRIVQGSQFATNSSTANLLFCPMEDIKEKCLITTEFDRYKPLQCTKEATPIVREMTGKNSKCGWNLGVIHDVIYELCYNSERHDMKFYEVCYNKDKNRSLFTMHGILSPRLLFSNLLLRERAMEHFTMMTKDSEPVSNPEAEESIIGYKLQKLVPSEDMPFGLWKKTTYQRINADWQHEKLIPLWNKINNHIREYCYWHIVNRGVNQSQSQHPIYKKYSQFDDNTEYYAFTGVIDIEYETEGPTEDQKSNIWVKIMKADGPKDRESIAILMNNFLIKNGEFSTSPKAKENIIRKYCKESLCSEDLEKEFEKIGGRIHCCPLSEEIAKLFGKLLLGPPNEVMSITGVTK